MTHAHAKNVVDGQPIVGAILQLVRKRTGCDFSTYRPGTVYRRIQNRMISVGVSSFVDYLALLEANDDEVPRLVERLTIKVSRFYRNAPTFDLLRNVVVPACATRRGGEPLRVWSAGCGFGEEAYTLAMLLDTAGVAGEVVASDVDPAALAVGRTGIYEPESVVELPRDLRDRYLEPVREDQRERYRVCDALRSRVRFVRHDLTADIPLLPTGSVDLVCCRNVLIYLQRETQERTLQAIRTVVAHGGFLCLGEAEWPPAAVAASLESLGHRVRCFRAHANFSEADRLVSGSLISDYLAVSKRLREAR
jgi:chemotaxis methyl-accepting protein methylase